MALKIEFNHPEQPKGEEFDIAGVLVKNGGSAELTEAQEQAIAARYHAAPKDVLGGNQFIKVTGSAILTGKDLEAYLPLELEGGES